MPVESADDRSSLFSTDEFATMGTYTPSGGSGVEIAGIFDNPHLSVVVGDRAETSDARPTFFCQSDDLPIAARGGDVGDTIVISAVTWRVVDLQPDGQGMTLLSLGK